MWKYIRILRLEDQYLQFGASMMAGIFLRSSGFYILWWAVATTFLSFTAFIVNELTDRNDSDKYTWNPIHIKADETFDMRIVLALFTVCSIVGLSISWMLGYVWWGIAIYCIGLIYSLEPIRCKRRFAVDLIAQTLVWFVLPFSAPVVSQMWTDYATLFCITMALCGLSIVFPYQLADFIPDQKAKFHNTHIVLGMQRSLVLGSILGIVGIILYGTQHIYLADIWTVPMILLLLITLVLYMYWLALRELDKQVKALQRYVIVFKRYTQVFVAYIFLAWLWI